MESDARHVVVVTAAGVDLPSLVLVHAPEFDLPIVSARHHQRQRWMERRPVDTAVVSLEDVLHNGVCLPEQVGGRWILEVILEATWTRRNDLLAQT